MNTELQNTFSNRVTKLFNGLKDARTHLEIELVNYANTKREIGILLKEWCNREQITFSWYEQHQHELGFTYEEAKKFISIANAMPDKAETLHDVRRVVQMEFILIAERTAQHSVTSKGPLSEFVHYIHEAKFRLSKWMADEPVEDWAEDRKEHVRSEIAWAVELNERLGS